MTIRTTLAGLLGSAVAAALLATSMAPAPPRTPTYAPPAGRSPPLTRAPA